MSSLSPQFRNHSSMLSLQGWTNPVLSACSAAVCFGWPALRSGQLVNAFLVLTVLDFIFVYMYPNSLLVTSIAYICNNADGNVQRSFIRLWTTGSTTGQLSAFRENTPIVWCSTLVPTCHFLLLPKHKVLHIRIQNMSGCSKVITQAEK